MGGLAIWFVIGVAVLVFSWVAEANLIKTASSPQRFRFKSAEVAQSRFDDVALVFKLAGSEWTGHGDSSRKVFYPRVRLADPYQLMVDVAANGAASLTLRPEGSSKSMLLGFLPLGPAMPFGTQVFVSFAKALRGAKARRSPGRYDIQSLERLLYFKFHVLFFVVGIVALFTPSASASDRLLGVAISAVALVVARRKWQRMAAEAASRDYRANSDGTS